MKITNPFENLSNKNNYNFTNNINGSQKSYNPSNNFYSKSLNNNNDYQINYPEKNTKEDSEFEIIMHEFNTKIKPLNSSSNFITSS